jgi:hypothetical protein
MMKFAVCKSYVPDGTRDDNRWGILLLGYALVRSLKSGLELNQVCLITGSREAARRRVAWRGKLADGHGGLVAGVSSGAVRAVLRYFVAKDQTLSDVEIEAFKEVRDTSEEAYALDALGLGLIEKGASEQPAGSVSRRVGTDDDGADLCEVRTVDVKGGASDELLRRGFDDGEGVDVFADLCVTTGEQGPVEGEAVDELMDGAGVLQLRFARSHGCGWGLVFLRGGRDCECWRERRGRGFLYQGQCHMPLHFFSFRVVMEPEGFG